MKKASIVMDNYKLKIFKRNLKNAGFSFDEEMRWTDNTKLLVTHYDHSDFDALLEIIKESNEQGKK